jgi:hypothetical protein
MQTMTRNELVAFFTGIRGATFATITTETEPKLLKTGNTLGDVRKVSRVNVCLGFQYEAAVNRQREREGATADFEAASRQWGERVAGTVLVSHKGKTYLETKVQKSLDHKYLGANGTILPDELIAPFLPKKSPGRQDLEKEVMVRDYAIDTIRHIAVAGKEFVIVG